MKPALKLTHFIKRERLTAKYLCRLMFGHGRSFVSLNTILGEKVKPTRKKDLPFQLRQRISKAGWTAGVVHWCWDVGYMVESGRVTQAAAARGN